jgi:hypothetical protein
MGDDEASGLKRFAGRHGMAVAANRTLELRHEGLSLFSGETLLSNPIEVHTSFSSLADHIRAGVGGRDAATLAVLAVVE